MQSLENEHREVWVHLKHSLWDRGFELVEQIVLRDKLGEPEFSRSRKLLRVPLILHATLIGQWLQIPGGTLHRRGFDLLSSGHHREVPRNMKAESVIFGPCLVVLTHRDIKTITRSAFGRFLEPVFQGRIADARAQRDARADRHLGGVVQNSCEHFGSILLRRTLSRPKAVDWISRGAV